MTPVPTLDTDPIVDPVGPTTLAITETLDTGWVPCYRARGIYLKESWDGGPGADLYSTIIEFSDDAATVIAGNAVLENGFNSFLSRTACMNYGSAISKAQFRWPFVCPFRFVRFTSNASGDVTNLVLSVTCDVDDRDLVVIERTTVLASATRAAGSYPTDWFIASDLRAVVALYLFSDAATDWLSYVAEFTDDEAIVYDEQIVNPLGGTNCSDSGSLTTFDDLSQRVAASGHYLMANGGSDSACERKTPGRWPFGTMRVVVGPRSLDRTFSVDVITFRDPS
jgi:hypothetical protein